MTKTSLLPLAVVLTISACGPTPTPVPTPIVPLEYEISKPRVSWSYRDDENKFSFLLTNKNDLCWHNTSAYLQLFDSEGNEVATDRPLFGGTIRLPAGSSVIIRMRGVDDSIEWTDYSVSVFARPQTWVECAKAQSHRLIFLESYRSRYTPPNSYLMAVTGTIVNASDCTVLDVGGDAAILDPGGELAQTATVNVEIWPPIPPNGSQDVQLDPVLLQYTTDEIVWMLRADLECPESE